MARQSLGELLRHRGEIDRQGARRVEAEHCISLADRADEQPEMWRRASWPAWRAKWRSTLGKVGPPRPGSFPRLPCTDEVRASLFRHLRWSGLFGQSEGRNKVYRDCDVMPSGRSYPLPVTGIAVRGNRGLWIAGGWSCGACGREARECGRGGGQRASVVHGLVHTARRARAGPKDSSTNPQDSPPRHHRGVGRRRGRFTAQYPSFAPVAFTLHAPSGTPRSAYVHSRRCAGAPGYRSASSSR